MNFDIAIFYREDMPEQMVSDLVRDLRIAGVNVETEKRPNEPVAMVEWALPAFVIFIASQYVSGFVKELAKDHYQIIKARLSKSASEVSQINQQVIVSSNAPNKLQTGSPVISSFAFWSQTLDGRSVKFLFLGGRDEDYYNTCCVEM